MDIEYKMLPKATLQEFADSHGFSMMVIERLDHGKKVYRAHFKENVVIRTIGGTQYTTFGCGDSPTLAIQDYAAKISDEELIHIIYSGSAAPHETYIPVPLLTYNPNAIPE